MGQSRGRKEEEEEEEGREGRKTKIRENRKVGKGEQIKQKNNISTHLLKRKAKTHALFYVSF